MKRFKIVLAVLAASFLFTGCGIVNELSAGNCEVTSGIQLVSFDNSADVEVFTNSGIKTEKITVTTPQKALNIVGTDLPNVPTASWFTFDIKGVTELSDVYASDIYGNVVDYGPSNGNIFLGRIYKLDNGKYGMLIPNGMEKTIADEEGNIKLIGKSINIRIGNTVFTAERK